VGYGTDYAWPPISARKSRFIVPIKSVISSDGRDYSDDVRRLAGPKGDFHGVDVKVSDVMGDVTLEVENVIGAKRTLTSSDVF
jgi:hypothetical protein